MTELQFYSQISSLPKDMQQEVADFVAFLQQKAKKSKPRKERKFGSGKGFFTISSDFDDPLEDFKEYQ
jgi:hypothetical protein